MKKNILLLLCLTSVFILNATVTKTVTNSAGELFSNLTINEKATITSLYVSGTIDARDFKTMRDSMPLLAEIDISETSIVEYSGTNGTGTVSEYEANHVPFNAFNIAGTYSGKTTLSSLILPESVTNIKTAAFRGCTGLSSLNMPSSLAVIDSWVFDRCGNSLDIAISATTSISNNTFTVFNGTITIDVDHPFYSSEEGVFFNKAKTILYSCPTIKSGNYLIPSTVNDIYIYAFSDCSDLSSITIPVSVSTIGNRAFYNCTNLSAIYAYPATPVDISNKTYVFKNIDQTSCRLYIPDGSLTAYQNANQWQDFSSIVEIDGIRLSGNKRGIGADQNSETTVDLFAYTGWTTSSNQTWLSCSPSSGNSDATLTLTADVNTTTQTRIALVSINVPGHATHTIRVTQDAGPGIATLYDLEIKNRTISSSTPMCFGAENTITMAGNGSVINLENGSNVNLIAGQSISFLPGFHAKSGSQMNASITTNGSFCTYGIIIKKSQEEVRLPSNDDCAIDQSTLKIFPNPNKGCFNIKLENRNTSTQIIVFNAMGAVVYQSKTNDEITSIDLSNAQKGIYFIQAISEQKQLSQKIIIE